MRKNRFSSVARIGRGMNQQRGARVVALSLALAALLAAGLTLSLRGSRAQSGGGQPDYSNELLLQKRNRGSKECLV